MISIAIMMADIADGGTSLHNSCHCFGLRLVDRGLILFQFRRFGMIVVTHSSFETLLQCHVIVIVGVAVGSCAAGGKLNELCSTNLLGFGEILLRPSFWMKDK